MSNRATRRAAARQAMFAQQTPTGRPETSEAQLAANRANAQFSSGPKTEQGKLVSSHNALKTGLTGRTIVLPTDDVAAYQSLVALINKNSAPPTTSNNTSFKPSPIPNGVSSASLPSNPASTLSAVTNSPPTALTNPTPNSALPCSKPTSSAPIKRTCEISPCKNAVSAINSNRTPPNSAACKRNAANGKPQRNRARQQAPPSRKMASNFQLRKINPPTNPSPPQNRPSQATLTSNRRQSPHNLEIAITYLRP